MNPKFRKKPVIIEAFQMTPAHRQDNSEWPEWMHKAWQKERSEEGSLHPASVESDGTDQLEIKTLEGNHLVGWGDYIIQGVNGEIYPCKPDIFDKTYEAVSE